MKFFVTSDAIESLIFYRSLSLKGKVCQYKMLGHDSKNRQTVTDVGASTLCGLRSSLLLVLFHFHPGKTNNSLPNKVSFALGKYQIGIYPFHTKTLDSQFVGVTAVGLDTSAQNHYLELKQPGAAAQSLKMEWFRGRIQARTEFF